MPADEKTAALQHGQRPDSSSLSVGDAVWVSDQVEGFVRGVVREIHGEGTDEAKVVVEVDGSHGAGQHLVRVSNDPFLCTYIMDLYNYGKSRG